MNKQVHFYTVSTSVLADLSFLYGLSRERFDGKVSGLYDILPTVDKVEFSYLPENKAFYFAGMSGYYLPTNEAEIKFVDSVISSAIEKLSESEYEDGTEPSYEKWPFQTLRPETLKFVYEGTVEKLKEVLNSTGRSFRNKHEPTNRHGCYFVLEHEYRRVVTNVGIVFNYDKAGYGVALKLFKAMREEFVVAHNKCAAIRTMPGQGPMYLEVQGTHNWNPIMYHPAMPEAIQHVGYKDGFGNNRPQPVLNQTFGQPGLPPHLNQVQQFHGHQVYAQPFQQIGQHPVYVMFNQQQREEGGSVVYMEHLGHIESFPMIINCVYRNEEEEREDFLVIPLVNIGNTAYMTHGKETPFGYFNGKAKAFLAKLRKEGELISLANEDRNVALALYRDKVLKITFSIESDSYVIAESAVFRTDVVDIRVSVDEARQIIAASGLMSPDQE